MNLRNTILPLLAAVSFLSLSPGARADDLRNIKHGAPVPACKLPAIDGTVVDSDTMKGSVVVYVCLSADQKRSDAAATESQQVVEAIGNEPIRLIHLTSDVVDRAYFEKFRQEHKITAPLLFDADRAFYAKLGLIAFPTTIIVNKDGNLENAIFLHGNDYKNLLDSYIRHALGSITDEELQSRLSARPSDKGSPKSAASAHRALARLMREKGQLDAARTELAKGLELDPSNHEMMLDMAEIELASGNLDKAELNVAKVLAVQSDHRRAMQIKGTIFFRQDKLDEAQVILEQALPLNPSPEVVHYYLGQIMERKGDKDKAIEHYRESLKHFMKQAEPAGAAPAQPAPEAPAKPS